MQPILKAVADLLERAEILEQDATVRGHVDDRLVSFALKLDDMGSVVHQWTEARAPAPEGLVVRMLPRRRAYSPWSDRLLLRWELAKGITVSHATGDPSFDAAFLVEGAPGHVVQRLLAEGPIREGLLALSRAYTPAGELRHGEGPLYEAPMLEVGERRVVVRLPRWVTDPDRAALLVRTVARLAAVGAEIARGEDAGARLHDTSDYRGKAAQERSRRDEQEVRDFEIGIEKRAAWRRRQQIRGWVLGAIALVVYASAIFTYMYLKGEWRPFD